MNIHCFSLCNARRGSRRVPLRNKNKTHKQTKVTMGTFFFSLSFQ